jgi:hypothetical protein
VQKSAAAPLLCSSVLTKPQATDIAEQKTRAMRRMLPAGSGFQLLIFEFSGNPEIQQGYGLHNVVFRPAAAALGNRPADVPGYRQQEELTDSFDISG